MTRARHRAAAREARGRTRELADAKLAAFRRASWDAQRDEVADGVTVPRPTYRKRVMPSPLVTRAEPVPRTRERGSYTRELVRATTRGHDHVPVRPIDPPRQWRIVDLKQIMEEAFPLSLTVSVRQ